MSDFVPCPSCGRHVRALVTSCPFCAARLGTTSAPGRYALGLALGLAFAACGEADKDDELTTAAETSASDTSDGTPTGPDGPGMTSAVPGETSATSSTDPDQGGEDYGGFGETSWEPEPEPETGPGPEGTDTGGEDTTSSTGSEGTGSTTGEPAGTDQGG